jgi:hypothetical protein
MVTRVMELPGFRGEVAAETSPDIPSWLCPLAFILLVAGDLLCLGNSGAWIAGPPTVACGAAALILAEKYRERRGGRCANAGSPGRVSMLRP